MRRAMRATIGVLVLLVLLVGVPIGLLAAGRSFLPAVDTNPSALWTEFTTQDSGQLLLAVIVAVGLLAWAGFALSVVLEVASRVGKVATPTLPGLGWAQGSAAMFLGLVVLSSSPTQASPSALSATPAALATTQSLSVSAEQMPTTAVETSDRETTTSGKITPSAAREEIAAPAGPYVTTVRGDSLWRLAQTHLGDGMRWKEIAELNVERAQADGQHLTVDDPSIPVGWVLLLPDDAVNVPPSTTLPEGTEEVLVQPGDTLSELAQTYLGSASRADEIAATTAPRTQPDGRHLTDPNIIDVGWTVEVPTANQSPAPRGLPVPAPSAPPTPAPQVCPPPARDPSPNNSISAPPTTTPVSATDVTAGWTTLSDYTAFGALLAAGVLAALGARRMMQQRRRRPGQRMVGPKECSTIELALRGTEDPPTVALLNAALRTWAARSGGRTLPDVIGAVIGTRITLLLASPAEPSSPFVAGPTPTQWVLDGADTVDEDTDVVAPFPTLVTIGRDPAGEIVLIDLERAGAMTLDGEPEDVVDVLSAMAIELAVSGWADHLDVTVVGLSPELVGYLGGGRLRHEATFDEVLSRLERHHQEVLDALTEDAASSAVDARVRGVAEQAWTPEVVLTAHPVTDEQRDRLARIVTTGATTNLAAVITAAHSSVDPLPGPWVVQVPPSGLTPLPLLNTTVELQRLTKADRDALVADFAATESTEQVPGPDATAIPPEPSVVVPPQPSGPRAARAAPEAHEPSDEERAELASLLHIDPGAPEVQVLGTIGITGVDPSPGVAGASKVLELGVYLALNTGRGPAEVSRQLGEDGAPWADSTRRSRLSQLRTWLGSDADGNDYVLAVTGATGYRLASTVRTDWQRFQTLVARGLHRGPEGLPWLDAALQLVRGVPFSSAPYRRYEWADVERRDMTNRIVDVSHAASTGHLSWDPRKAVEAAVLGLVCEPHNEVLYRDLFRAEYAAGNIDGIRTAADRLRRKTDDLDADMQPETVELLAQLLDPHRRHDHAAQ
jgi:LysM repeat protein/DNA-binding SARP family transcriptional activator